MKYAFELPKQLASPPFANARDVGVACDSSCFSSANRLSSLSLQPRAQEGPLHASACALLEWLLGLEVKGVVVRGERGAACPSLASGVAGVLRLSCLECGHEAMQLLWVQVPVQDRGLASLIHVEPLGQWLAAAQCESVRGPLRKLLPAQRVR